MSSDDQRKNIFLEHMAIHRKTRMWQTNLYLTPIQIGELSQKDGILSYQTTDFDALLEPYDDFYRLYYSAANLHSLVFGLKELLKYFPLNTIVVDQLSTPQSVEQITVCFQEAGFVQQDLLRQMYMQAAQVAVLQSHPEVERAEVEDVAEIFRLLYQTFNRYVSRLPSIEQVQERVIEQSVYLVRNTGNINGFIMLQKLNQNQLLIDQLLVSKEQQHRGIGQKLLETGIHAKGGGQMAFLWSLSTAVGFYKKCGFQMGNRVDVIFAAGNNISEECYRKENNTPRGGG